jgi:hypothetical protein
MKCLLFIDLLGARARWKSGGVDASRLAFNQFTQLMIRSARPDLPSVVDGAIETDSCALLCENPAVALRIGSRAFNRAFGMDSSRTGHRLWLRGAVVPSESAALRTVRPAFGDAKQLSIFVYSHELLDAVSVEKAGFKGMRLLVRDSLVTEALKCELALSVKGLKLYPLKRLRHSSYPSTSDGLHDYLWPAVPELDDWREKEIIMSRRLRDSNSDSEEFAQAAATQVVFHEVAALLNALHHKATRRDIGPAIGG